MESQQSVTEYLSTSYRPDCDYVDGEVLERNVGEYEHSRPQIAHLRIPWHSRKEWRIRVVLEQRVQVSASRFRIPDVCVVLADAPVESIFRLPPFLCIEIHSKDDSLSGTIVERLDEYLTMGVANIWVVDPSTRRGYRYTAEGLAGSQRWDPPHLESALEVPLSALFD